MLFYIVAACIVFVCLKDWLEDVTGIAQRRRQEKFDAAVAKAEREREPYQPYGAPSKPPATPAPPTTPA